jgi:hypothetical protein
MCRLQQLSFESGVIRSEGKTHASDFVSTASCRHASTSAARLFSACEKWPASTIH